MSEYDGLVGSLASYIKWYVSPLIKSFSVKSAYIIGLKGFALIQTFTAKDKVLQARALGKEATSAPSPLYLEQSEYIF